MGPLGTGFQSETWQNEYISKNSIQRAVVISRQAVFVYSKYLVISSGRATFGLLSLMPIIAGPLKTAINEEQLA
jgi:hypothetical protein